VFSVHEALSSSACFALSVSTPVQCCFTHLFGYPDYGMVYDENTALVVTYLTSLETPEAIEKTVLFHQQNCIVSSALLCCFSPEEAQDLDIMKQTRSATTKSTDSLQVND